MQAWLSSETLLRVCKLYPKHWSWRDCTISKESEQLLFLIWHKWAQLGSPNK